MTKKITLKVDREVVRKIRDALYLAHSPEALNLGVLQQCYPLLRQILQQEDLELIDHIEHHHPWNAMMRNQKDPK